MRRPQASRRTALGGVLAAALLSTSCTDSSLPADSEPERSDAPREVVTDVGGVEVVGDKGWLGDAATGSDGTVFAVWAAGRGLGFAETRPGDPWGPEATLFADAGWFTLPTSAMVGVDDAGDVTVAWLEERRGPGRHVYRVLASSRPTGGTWSEPQVLTTQPYTDYSTFDMDLVVGAGGHAALWWEDVEPEDRTQVTYRGPDGAWDRPTHLPRGTSGCCVRVAVDEDGVAAFLFTDAGRLVLQQRTPDGWLPPTRLTTGGAGPGSRLNLWGLYDVATSGSGDFVVAWSPRDRSIHAGHFEDGAWSEEEPPLLKDAGPPRVQEVHVSADDSGGAAYLWLDGDPGTLYGTYQESPGSVPEPTVVIGTKVWVPEVAHDSMGATVAWTGPNRVVYLARHDIGTPAGAWAEPVELTASRTDEFSGLAMSASPGSTVTTVLWEGAPRGAVLARRVTTAPP